VFVGGGANLVTFQSCVDPGNGQNVCPAPFTTPVLSPPITGVGAYAATNNIVIAALAAPFSINEIIHFNLSGLSSLNYSASSVLMPVTPVPEPITMFLGGTGLLALAFAARRRLFRRQS
jgi:hypothetical protein